MSLKQLSQPKQCEKYLSTGLIFPDKLGVGSADWIFFFFHPGGSKPFAVKMQMIPQTLKMEPGYSWVPSERMGGNGNKLKHGM